MEITLDTIRQTLRNAFGRDSFAASFITNIIADKNCPTASIDSEGTMRYNPQFVEKNVQGPKDVFCLVAHELMHPMFGHFVYGGGQLENVGADMVINSVLSILFARHSGNGALFRKVYKPIGLGGLLRPGSDMRQSRYARLYKTFYPEHMSYPSKEKLSTGEVIQALKVLTPMQESQCVVLLGSHGKERLPQGKTGADASESPSAWSVPSISKDTLARVAEDFKRAAENPSGKGAGYCDNLYDFFLEVMKTHLSIRKVLLERFATKQKVDRFKQSIDKPRISVSPIPIQPSKRDLVLLAADILPFHYHNHAYRVTNQERGLAIYLDVSGSVNDHLPEIIGVIQSLKRDLLTIFLFSNKVVEVPFRTLLQGKVQTTFGTDFNCIATSLVEQGLDKAVIVTDGYATMSEEHLLELRVKKIRTLAILFGGRRECPEFAATGDIVQLEDIVS